MCTWSQTGTIALLKKPPNLLNLKPQNNFFIDLACVQGLAVESYHWSLTGAENGLTTRGCWLLAANSTGMVTHLSSFLQGHRQRACWVSSEHGSSIPRVSIRERDTGSFLSLDAQTRAPSLHSILLGEQVMIPARVQGGEHDTPAVNGSVEKKLSPSFICFSPETPDSWGKGSRQEREQTRGQNHEFHCFGNCTAISKTRNREESQVTLPNVSPFC